MQPKVTEITLDSGVRVFVAPLSRYQRNALAQAAERLYPLPDPEPYEVELPEDVAIPGMKIPADENPAYLKLVQEINRQRADHIASAMLNLCLTYPDFPHGRSQLIEHFADWLNEQREWMELPDDPWEATLRFAIIRSVADENQVLAIARDDLPVTEFEVGENVRIFRPLLSREKSRIVEYARKFTPGPDSKVSSNQ